MTKNEFFNAPTFSPFFILKKEKFSGNSNPIGVSDTIIMKTEFYQR